MSLVKSIKVLMALNIVIIVYKYHDQLVFSKSSIVFHPKIETNDL